MLNNNWNNLLKDEFEKDYFKNLIETIKAEEKKYIVYPKSEDCFNALKLTDYENVKCVILGQDPYHGEYQAHGLAFSVQQGVKIPPSLKNIFKELKNDLGYDIPTSGDLTKWAKEGVLLLNTVLTVRCGCANSHANLGWEIFTDKIISLLNEHNRPICFILWGNNAKKKMSLITNNKHLILTGTHPSPLSCYNGFFDCKYFSKVNNFLDKTNQKIIDWNLNY